MRAALGWAEPVLPDLDSLDVGQGALDGLSDGEKTAMATLWAVVGAPIYTGNDLLAMDAFGTAMLAATATCRSWRSTRS